MYYPLLLKIQKVLAYFFCALSVLLVFALTYDIINFINNTAEYAVIYKDISFNDYLLKDVFLLISCIIVFSLSLFSLLKTKRTFSLILLIIYVLIVLFMSYNIYQWYLNGFDH